MQEGGSGAFRLSVTFYARREPTRRGPTVLVAPGRQKEGHCSIKGRALDIQVTVWWRAFAMVGPMMQKRLYSGRCLITRGCEREGEGVEHTECTAVSVRWSFAFGCNGKMSDCVNRILDSIIADSIVDTTHATHLPHLVTGWPEVGQISRRSGQSRAQGITPDPERVVSGDVVDCIG